MLQIDYERAQLWNSTTVRQLLKKGHPQPCLSTQLCSAHVPRKAPLCPYLVHCDVWSIKLLRRICCTAMIGQGKSQPYWLKYDSRNSFIRVGSDSRNTVHTGRQFSAGSRPFSIGFSLKHSRSCLAMAFFFFLIWAQLATRSLSQQVFSLSGSTLKPIEFFTLKGWFT